MARSRTQALGNLYKKITNEDMPAGANTTTEALQKVYEALTNDTTHHINVTEIIDDLATNWSGGGGSWQTVFEGSVTTVADDPAPIGLIQNVPLTADTIKVTFNGVEYECGKHADGSYGAIFDEGTEQFDWSTYPFSMATLQVEGSPIDVYTETAGTYSIKIEAPAESGSSDFDTATVTFTNTTDSPAEVTCAICVQEEDNMSVGSVYFESQESVTIDVILYKGTALAVADHGTFSVVSGDATISGDTVIISGDCTLSISSGSGHN